MSWPNAVADLITLFQNAPTNNISTETLTLLLLEILTVIPEEVSILDCLCVSVKHNEAD